MRLRKLEHAAAVDPCQSSVPSLDRSSTCPRARRSPEPRVDGRNASMPLEPSSTNEGIGRAASTHKQAAARVPLPDLRISIDRVSSGGAVTKQENVGTLSSEAAVRESHLWCPGHKLSLNARSTAVLPISHRRRVKEAGLIFRVRMPDSGGGAAMQYRHRTWGQQPSSLCWPFPLRSLRLTRPGSPSGYPACLEALLRYPRHPAGLWGRSIIIRRSAPPAVLPPPKRSRSGVSLRLSMSV